MQGSRKNLKFSVWLVCKVNSYMRKSWYHSPTRRIFWNKMKHQHLCEEKKQTLEDAYFRKRHSNWWCGWFCSCTNQHLLWDKPQWGVQSFNVSNIGISNSGVCWHSYSKTWETEVSRRQWLKTLPFKIFNWLLRYAWINWFTQGKGDFLRCLYLLFVKLIILNATRYCEIHR